MLRDGLAMGDEEASPQAAMLLAAQSEPAEAERLYRLVLTNWPAQAPAALVQLGLLLNRQGLLDDAMVAYQQAAGSGDLLAAPRAMVNLGDLCRRVGNESLAQSWYERAMAAGNDYQADRAAVNLAALHLVRGELDEAAAVCLQGLASAYPDLAEFAGKVRDQITQQRRSLEGDHGTPETGGAAPSTSEAGRPPQGPPRGSVSGPGGVPCQESAAGGPPPGRCWLRPVLRECLHAEVPSPVPSPSRARGRRRGASWRARRR
jgi:tetratricopeptide (TPR) repeat protein